MCNNCGMPTCQGCQGIGTSHSQEGSSYGLSPSHTHYHYARKYKCSCGAEFDSPASEDCANSFGKKYYCPFCGREIAKGCDL